MLRSIIIFFCSAFFLTPLLIGQEQSKEDTVQVSRVQIVEASLDLSQPLADFKRKLDKTPIGFSTRYYWQVKAEQPVFLGLSFNYAHLLSASEEYIDFIDGYELELKQSIKSHMTGIHFLFRYYPAIYIPSIQPYFEGFAGTKILFATDVVRDLDSQESIQFEFRNGNIALSYGLASGFQLNLKDGIWYLNARLSYELGTSSGFLGFNPVDSQDIFDMEERNVAIQIMRYQLGASFVF